MTHDIVNLAMPRYVLYVLQSFCELSSYIVCLMYFGPLWPVRTETMNGYQNLEVIEGPVVKAAALL